MENPNTPPPKIKGGPQNLIRWLNELRDFALKNRILHGGVPGWDGSPEGVRPPYPGTGGESGSKNGCCGTAALMGSNEMNTLFVRSADEPTSWADTTGGVWAGYYIYDKGDSFFNVGTSPSDELYLGAVPGLEDVPFNLQRPAPGNPDTVFFVSMPLKVTASAGGEEHELTHSISGVVGSGGFEYYNAANGWRLWFNPFPGFGSDPVWQLDAGLTYYAFGRKALDFAGEYGDSITGDEEDSENFAWVAAGGAWPAGDEGNVQFRGSASRSLQGSRNFTVVQL